MIYTPREDSYLLKEILKKYAKNKSVLDMGAGSGILSLAALEAGAKSVVAVDINKKAVQHIAAQKINAIESNLFSRVKGKFSIIVCNPPYLPEDSQEDLSSRKITTGGKRGDEFILRFLAHAKKHVNSRGEILLLLSSLTPRKRIHALLTKHKMQKRVIGRKKLFMEQLEVWSIKRTFKKRATHSAT